MTQPEYKVLKALQNAPTDKSTNNQMGALNYGELSKKTKLSREVLASVIKKLMKEGLVEYLRGIVNRDGKSAGSGFRLPTYPSAKKRKIIGLIGAYEVKEEKEKIKSQATKKAATKQPSTDQVPTKSDECTPCTATNFHIEMKRSGMTANELFWALADLVGFFSAVIVLAEQLTNGKPLDEKNWLMIPLAIVLVVWISLKR